MSDDNKTYVYNGTEVIMTGRVAARTMSRSKKVHTIYEIQPADNENGTWKKWVTKEELYEIR